ncbi:MAG: tRNA (guanosine(46)-N7)-methyltransferase TrmB [Phycisphaerae bacterium]|jgi:tRNA (guanine-N7-)-methyltransferase
MNSPKHLSHGNSERLDGSGVLLDEAVARGPVDLAAMFGNDHPVEIEIGTGKGTFLAARAAARPEINFLGIEWARAYCLYAADRFRRAGLANVRMLHTDAGEFFPASLADESLLRIHVYFPDPWPKRRHHRRRLIQPPFLAQARRTLRIGGQLVVVTDHLDYFFQMQRVLLEAPGFVSVPMPKMSDRDGELVGTNFERKYIAQGRPFYSAALMKYW